MKSKRALIMIATALLAGLAAVWLAYRWIGHLAESTTSVVVAARDVDPGTVLSDSALQTMAWPSVSVPVGAIKDVGKATGRVASTLIFTGEPILEAKLAQVGATGGLSAVLAPGKRAISIQANEIVGVAGYVHPGSRVDIMVNVRTSQDQERPTSKIVLTNLLVLATAQDDKRDQTKPKVVSTVTLEVDPHQAEKIDLARSIGTLSLVLRNPLDTAVVQTVGATRDDVMGSLDQAPALLPPAAAASAPVAATAASPSKPKPKPRVVAKVGPREPSPAPKPVDSVEIIRGVQKANSNF